MAKRKKRRNFLRKNYGESWNYISESRNFIYAIASTFALFILLGAFFPVPDEIAQRILEFIKDLLRETEGMSLSHLFGFLFFNNLQSSFLGMILGIAFGLFSVFTIAVNGYLLGFVASRTVSSEGIFILWKLLPHGIFELPALILSLALGLRLGLWLIIEPVIFYWKRNKLMPFLFILFYLPALIITLVFNKNFRKIMSIHLHKFKTNFWNSLQTFIFVVIPLLLIAAVIESSLISLFRG